jgi:hypothetical protein
MHDDYRTKVLLGCCILVLGGGLLAPAVHAAPPATVTLCHYPPDNPTNVQQITVAPSAVPAHVAHGDFVGPCAQDCRQHPSVCNDNNACTTDTCDTSNGTCEHTPLVCDDGNQCTTDTCDPAVGCTHGTVACNDGDPCTIDTCLNATGCSTVPKCPLGQTCDLTSGDCICTTQASHCDPSTPGQCCSGLTCTTFGSRLFSFCGAPSGAPCDISNPQGCQSGCCRTDGSGGFVCC